MGDASSLCSFFFFSFLLSRSLNSTVFLIITSFVSIKISLPFHSARARLYSVVVVRELFLDVLRLFFFFFFCVFLLLRFSEE